MLLALKNCFLFSIYYVFVVKWNLLCCNFIVRAFYLCVLLDVKCLDASINFTLTCVRNMINTIFCNFIIMVVTFLSNCTVKTFLILFVFIGSFLGVIDLLSTEWFEKIDSVLNFYCWHEMISFCLICLSCCPACHFYGCVM